MITIIIRFGLTTLPLSTTHGINIVDVAICRSVNNVTVRIFHFIIRLTIIARNFVTSTLPPWQEVSEKFNFQRWFFHFFLPHNKFSSTVSSLSLLSLLFFLYRLGLNKMKHRVNGMLAAYAKKVYSYTIVLFEDLSHESLKVPFLLAVNDIFRFHFISCTRGEYQHINTKTSSIIHSQTIRKKMLQKYLLLISFFCEFTFSLFIILRHIECVWIKVMEKLFDFVDFSFDFFSLVAQLKWA